MVVGSLKPNLRFAGISSLRISHSSSSFSATNAKADLRANERVALFFKLGTTWRHDCEGQAGALLFRSGAECWDEDEY